MEITTIYLPEEKDNIIHDKWLIFPHVKELSPCLLSVCKENHFWKYQLNWINFSVNIPLYNFLVETRIWFLAPKNMAVTVFHGNSDCMGFRSRIDTSSKKSVNRELRPVDASSAPLLQMLVCLVVYANYPYIRTPIFLLTSTPFSSCRCWFAYYYMPLIWILEGPRAGVMAVLLTFDFHVMVTDARNWLMYAIM